MPAPQPYDDIVGLAVDREFRAFVEREVLPAAGLQSTRFWAGLAATIGELSPRYRELLARRDDLQGQIDTWQRERQAKPFDATESEAFLSGIGYLVPEPAADAYRVATKNIDTEISRLNGVQVVAPLSDPRLVLAAVNGRWRSLRPVWGEAMSDRASEWLDKVAPLAEGSHREAVDYQVFQGALAITLKAGGVVALKDPEQCVGFNGPAHVPFAILLVRNGLHAEIVVSRDSKTAPQEAAAIADVIIEAVPTAIMDLDDTAIIAGTAERIAAYRTWLALMDGTFSIDGATLAPDRTYVRPAGGTLTLPGRPLLLIRHAGHHTFSDAIRDAAGNPVPEGIIDAAITVAGALRDIAGENRVRNSRTGSIYVLKPKMHGPDEVGLSDALFRHTEELLGLPRYTMKIGVADEERRTSLNLAACLSKVRDRTALTYTNRLGRAAGEIRAHFATGAVGSLEELTNAAWSSAYEDNNVAIGLARDLPGHALIGKTAWPAVNASTVAGANCWQMPVGAAVVPSALCFFEADVVAGQRWMAAPCRPVLAAQLVPALATRPTTDEVVAHELDRHLQLILEQVEHWLAPAGRRRDVATSGSLSALRAAVMHVTNWLRHGVVEEGRVRDGLRRLAGPDETNVATAAALLFKAPGLPGGYADAFLRQRRRDETSGVAVR